MNGSEFLCNRSRIIVFGFFSSFSLSLVLQREFKYHLEWNKFYMVKEHGILGFQFCYFE